MLHDLTVAFRSISAGLEPAANPYALSAPHAFGLTDPVTQTVFTGTSGNNSFTGAAADDTFHMEQGGDDTVKGKGGNDTIFFGATLTAADKIDGGADGGSLSPAARDGLYLSGDYSAGMVFNATTLVNVESIALSPGFDYKLTTNDATVASGDILLVNAYSIGAAQTFTFNSGAETDGTCLIYASTGLDKLTGGVEEDSYSFFAGALTATDRVDGGAGGDDTVTLAGDYSAGLTLAPATIRNIEVLRFGSGFSYDLTVKDGNLAAGATMQVFCASGVSNHSRFDGSAELDGKFEFGGSQNDDVLIGGHGNDSYAGNGGADRLTGGAGLDFFYYVTADDSTSTHYDTLVGFDFLAQDQIGFAGTVTGIDSTVRHGTLSTGTFDANLAAKVNAAHLAADHAVLYTPDAGGLAGSVFLIIDVNHTAGYQASADLVIALDGAVNLGSIDITDFS